MSGRLNRHMWAMAFGMALLATPLARAGQQDGGACFFINESGQQVDLGNLCGGGAGNARSSGFKARIKRRRGGTPVIDVTFNGRDTFEMLLDTGATATAIPESVAQQLAFRPEGTTLVSTPSDRSARLPFGRVDSVSVAGITARNVRVFVAPALELGLLGQNFYGDYDIIIRQDVVEFRRR